MRELAGERAQIAGVVVESAEQLRETTREVAEFVAGSDFRKLAEYAAFARQRCVARTAQPLEAQREAAPKDRDGSEHEARRQQSQIQQSCECAIAQQQPAISGLRDLQHPENPLGTQFTDRRSGRDDEPSLVGRRQQRRAALSCTSLFSLDPIDATTLGLNASLRQRRAFEKATIDTR